MSGGSLVVENDPFTRLIPISEIIRTKEQIVDTLGKLSCCGFNGVLLTFARSAFERQNVSSIGSSRFAQLIR